MYSIVQGTMFGITIAGGALLSSIFTIMISAFVKDKIDILHDEKSEAAGDPTKKAAYLLGHCNFLTFNNQIISHLPLSTHTLSFIVGHLSMQKSGSLNYYLIIPLTIFLLIDVIYNYLNCSGVFTIIPLFLGLILGIGWGYLNRNTIDQIKTGKEECSTNQQNLAFNCKRRGL
jgi:TRAP-type mannitol/chloroaromatic compound transport system permease small subunit